MKIIGLENLLADECKISALKQFLVDVGHDFTYYNDKINDEKEIIKRAENADIIIIANMPITKKIINECKKLKMISVAFTGVDHIDLNACKEKNITVCNAANYSTEAVAELTIGLIIELYRKIKEFDTKTRNLKNKEGFLGRQLHGKTLGIIGTGKIGMKVARYAKTFGCNIVAHSRTQKEKAKVLGIQYLSLEELLSKSDIISLHLPLNESTRLIIKQKEIESMKPDAILINTARGQLVDYKALALALKNNKISGVATDVYNEEPPLKSTNPLLNAPNTILLPHIGYATKEAIERRANIVFENILLWEQGSPQNIII